MAHLAFFIVAVAGAMLSVHFKKLTAAGGVAGFLVAVLIYYGLSWCGLVIMGAFFVMATVATAMGSKKEEGFRVTSEKNGRTHRQVLANGGLAALFGGAAILFPEKTHLCLLLLAAAFSSASADTVSSELGSRFGTRFYDVLHFDKGIQGDNGVISLEGLALGLLASAVIGLLHSWSTGNTHNFLPLLLAGLVGNLADSLLGALLERRGLLTNNAVNFLNTVIAALFATIIY